MTTFRSALVFVSGVSFILMVWLLQPAGSVSACVVTSGPAPLPEIPEASGLAVGRRNPTVLWSHNDSGNAAVLFAIDTAGRTLGRVRVPISTRDWEDISAARCGANDCLYLADIGDNGSRRQRIRIYRVPEPSPGDAETAPPEVFDASYADGPHNAEAMFVIGTELFIVTRDRTGGIYKSALSDARELVFQRIGQLGLAAVTDAEASTDGKFVVVRTSDAVVLYRSEDLVRGANVPQQLIPIGGLREAQGEGVAVDGSNLYLASEGRPWSRAGRLVSLRCTLTR